MARGGYSVLTLDEKSLNKVLNVAMNKIDRGTKKATQAAMEEIQADSLSRVPRDTETLASSAYHEVYGSSRVGFVGVVGYGGHGDPINPKNGKPASSYMIEVHEDLEAYHKIGEAKFLENAVREFQMNAGARLAQIIGQELKW